MISVKSILFLLIQKSDFYNCVMILFHNLLCVYYLHNINTVKTIYNLRFVKLYHPTKNVIYYILKS